MRRLSYHCGNLPLVLILLQDGLVDTIDFVPLDIIILVHELNAIRDTGYELFFLVIIRSQ